MVASNLHIKSSMSLDEGVFQCLASNSAGTRESHKANLSVYGEFWNKTVKFYNTPPCKTITPS